MGDQAKSQPKPDAKRKRSFTLIELLVVIAIIALLAAILLPSLNSARNLAKRIKCSSNQGQAMKAVLMYATDNNDWMIHAGFGGATYDVWASAIAGGLHFPQERYVSNMDILVCPTQGVKFAYGAVISTYGMYRGRNDTDYSAKIPTNGDFMVNSSQSFIFYSFKKLKSPTKFALLADTAFESSSPNAGKQFCFFVPTSDGGAAYGVSLQHDGKANCGFVDGHVESLDRNGCRSTNTQIKYTLTNMVSVTLP